MLLILWYNGNFYFIFSSFVKIEGFGINSFLFVILVIVTFVIRLVGVDSNSVFLFVLYIVLFNNFTFVYTLCDYVIYICFVS